MKERKRVLRGNWQY